MKRNWFGICPNCGKVYTNPDGLTLCCQVLTILCKDEKGTKYAEPKEPHYKFSDMEFNLFADMEKREIKERYVNIWRNGNNK